MDCPQARGMDNSSTVPWCTILYNYIYHCVGHVGVGCPLRKVKGGI